MNEEQQKNRANDHLANERTFLSWIRTSIGIITLGFVVVKFSLFMKQMGVFLGKDTTLDQKEYSGIVGLVLVAAGAVIVILAFISYKHSQKQLDEGSFKNSPLLVTVLTVFIFLVSLFLIVYLIKST